LQHCLLKQTKNLEENPDGFAGVLWLYIVFR
jgi:hypothetical protein